MVRDIDASHFLLTIERKRSLIKWKKKMKKNKYTDWIKVTGAREHNLKNINVEIPKNTLTVITGPSGSGKSTLALDILYTEGKRRYVESLSSYARQFLGFPKKPDVDSIEGLCPAIAIDQKTVSSNPRSTVGTITEIYDYMRVLFARIGKPHCPNCNIAIKGESPDKIAALLVSNFMGEDILIAAPIAIEKKGEFLKELEELFLSGYYRFIIDGQKYNFKNIEEIKKLNIKKSFRHNIDVLLDSAHVAPEEASRLQEAIERAFKITGVLAKVIVKEQEHLYSTARICLKCAKSFPELEPRLFSFNSPIGACKSCAGLGFRYSYTYSKDPEDYNFEETCEYCQGKRLNDLALAITINDKNIFDLSELSIKELIKFIQNLTLSETDKTIANRLVQEIALRLQFLIDVGLAYLSLNRTARTLSGGEGQRIRLATQIGSALSGVLYILDEPSIGLHQKDNDKLIQTLHRLKNQGNTVIVVEHDTDTMMASDYIIDMGPHAGILGGKIVAAGSPQEIIANKDSLTGAYLSGRKKINKVGNIRKPKTFITVKNNSKHNLKNIDVKFPLGVICGISGVSGSGKSTLIMDELVPNIHKILTKPYYKQVLAGADKKDLKIEGVENIDNMIVIDQSAIGRTSRSTPATYLGIFDDIRKLFTQLPESNARGYQIGRFSFNMPEGRCSECNGEGIITISMHFLADVTMTCNVCKGLRYNSQTLEIRFKNKNIAQILDMTASEASEFFEAHNGLNKRLKLLCEVGLDYLKLGQPSTTLSGGEAQRIKLVNELSKRGANTLYILDEPTTGLHSSDIEKLLQVLNSLVDKGNSIIVIEHNLEVLKTVDYLIDMGPEGGDEGGIVVAKGTPQEVANNKNSYTGSYLKRMV